MDYKEKCKNARAFVVLLAALISLLLNIKYQRDTVESLLIVLIVIIVFYIIATVAIKLIDKIRNMDVHTILGPEANVDTENGDQAEDTSSNSMNG